MVMLTKIQFSSMQEKLHLLQFDSHAGPLHAILELESLGNSISLLFFSRNRIKIIFIVMLSFDLFCTIKVKLLLRYS